MPCHATRGKSYQVAAIPSEEERKKSYYESRLTSGYTRTENYKQAVELLIALKKKPILLAKVKDTLDLSFTIIAYCSSDNLTLELWEVTFVGNYKGKVIEAKPYQFKDQYVDTLLNHTYYTLAMNLLKDPDAPPLIAPGILFKPLIEIKL